MLNLKKIITICLITVFFIGCTNQNNQVYPNNSNLSKSQQGAIIGGILGAIVGAATKGNSKIKRVAIGGAIGAAIGGGVGYSMDQQAKELAQELDTDVDNNPDSLSNPSKDLIISNTKNYVKIMLRDSMVFETNSSIPTYEASQKIKKISSVLENYPDTLVQVVGFTDSRGSYEYNQQLSEQRALNVANTIYNSEIPNDIFSKGCSYNKPLVPNINQENMALNRRVEIYLFGNQNNIMDACKN